VLSLDAEDAEANDFTAAAMGSAETRVVVMWRDRTRKSNPQSQESKQHESKQKEENRSPQEQPVKDANSWDRRTRSISPDPVDPAEEAMDVAIGDEGKPWVQRKRTA
jgi:hypothetical protein